MAAPTFYTLYTRAGRPRPYKTLNFTLSTLNVIDNTRCSRAGRPRPYSCL